VVAINYREIVPPKHFVLKESWEEQGRKATLITTVLFLSQEVRDTVLYSGAERLRASTNLLGSWRKHE
jgi:uncharacterized protein YndB with AHSA1/START domain